MTDAPDQILEQWRKHAEAGVRMMDAVVEATTHMREAQLSAAQEMWGEQWTWALASCERSAAYWRNLFEAMNEANGKIVRCLQDGASAAGPLPFSGELPSTGFEVVDKAYRDMIKSSQQFLQSATNAFAPPAPTARKEAKQAA